MRMNMIIFMLAISLPLSATSLGQSIHTAVQQGEIEQVKKLLSVNPQLVNAKDESGRTPLHWAARIQKLEMVKLLLERGADVNAKDDNGIAALHHLVFRGNLEGVEHLLEHGADVNIVDKDGNTPLSSTSFYFLYHQEIAELLIDRHADPLLSKDKGLDLLHKAAARGHQRMISYLIENGVDILERNGNDGTLLHSAAAGGLVEIVKTMIAKNDDVNDKNRYGFTPIHLAAEKGHREIVEMLLSNGADMNIKNTAGLTPYQLAFESGSLRTAEFLKEGGADTTIRELTIFQGAYFGLKNPGSIPELFAPGIVSNPDWEHSPPTFALNHDMVLWAEVPELGGGTRLMYSEVKNGYWTIPKPFPFISACNECYPQLTADGNILFFDSVKPVDENDSTEVPRIWKTTVVDSKWTKQVPLGSVINDGTTHLGFSIANDGTMYISTKRDCCLGGFDIYRSECVNGSYDELINLGEFMNSEHSEIFPAVSPNEDFLIFVSNRPDGLGGNDLYISFKNEDGTWTKSVNMGKKVNTEYEEWFPKVSPDKKYLFFVSNRNGSIGDIFWVDACIIYGLRPKELEHPGKLN